MLKTTTALCLCLGTSTVASKYEELECLYAAVGKVIYEGLTNYEKATSNTNPTQLFGKSLGFLFLLVLFCCVTVQTKSHSHCTLSKTHSTSATLAV